MEKKEVFRFQNRKKNYVLCIFGRRAQLDGGLRTALNGVVVTDYPSLVCDFLPLGFVFPS